MSLSSVLGRTVGADFRLAWADDERAFFRGWRAYAGGDRKAVLAVAGVDELGAADRLMREYELKEELDASWAARPQELLREDGRTILILDDPGAEPFDGLLGSPMELRDFLRLAVGLTHAIGRMHDRGIIHKDIKPANILVNRATGQVWLTGFGIAARRLRERPRPDQPEVIAGTFAYMAPEQTGRMNRSIDSRSDLYALGVSLYQMLTGSLPFAASDPMEWVHCHIARRPTPPHERSSNVPSPVSAVVTKLLAKMPEDRYQTAVGAESDLRRCLATWESSGRIDEFLLGDRDTPDRLLIPEKLYGRQGEIDALLASFNRVVTSGRPELVLVSGYSGIGKSAVVNEVHKALVASRGLFASGKFDQFKRDIPYATLAQAFKSLVASLLSKSDAELKNWRDTLGEALGPNGVLIVDLVPELKIIIGEQSPVPELPAQDAQRRFQLTLQRFIGVFARPEHPLALFLDDLQWLDTATLDLLENLLTQEIARYFLLIGAYRSNEVDCNHPLMRKLKSIRQSNALVQDIVLSPLVVGDIERLVAASLHCDTNRVTQLARLVYDKTAGNPFFAIQFISALSEEALLTFDHGDARWSWDLSRIHAKGYTDNVVDLMVGKLNRLPLQTQKALQQFACLGNVADSISLCIACEKDAAEVRLDLSEATRLEYIAQLDGAYRFAHDRVQEAAYSLIAEEQRAEAHVRIGRLLLAGTPSDKQEATIFEIVNQFNRGAALIISVKERERVAGLNLIAGRRAKAATAYASALSYFSAGSSLLEDDWWKQRYELTFALELNRAECEILTGEHEAAEKRLTVLGREAANQVDRAAVTCLSVELCTIQGRTERAIEVCLEYLRQEGIAWSAHPTDQDVRQEYNRLWRRIGSRSIEALVDLPVMNEPSALATMDVLTRIFPATVFSSENLAVLIATHMVNLSVQHGNTHASCCGYVWFAMMAGPIFGDYQSTRRFGQLSIDLVEKRGFVGFAARVYASFGAVVVPWTQHISTGQNFLRRAMDIAANSGDLAYSAYAFMILGSNLLACGEPLQKIEDAASTGMGFARTARFGLITDVTATHVQLIRTLRGMTREFGAFNDDAFAEDAFEQHLEANPSSAIAACWYWIRKMQARVWAHEHAAALAAAGKAEALLWTSRTLFEHAEYHFYGALARAASCREVTAPDFAALVGHHRQLEKWADACPENFGDRSALVAAEIARLEARELDAEGSYERAIRLARDQGFVANEGLAYELASRFYAARGFDLIARTYMREARQCYLRWGALGKVQQLDQLHHHLQEERSLSGTTNTIAAPVEQLDIATVFKVSQAVSGEMVVAKLIDSLMRAAIEHAGAERGLVLLFRGAGHRAVAEATTRGNTIVVELQDAVAYQPALPESVVQYVARTQDPVILGDASTQNQFSSDAYITEQHARSILCLPLLNQGRLIAVLYLENNLSPHVFTPGRIAVLKLLASQAAVSLENAHLYRDLEERETRIRRLVDANIIGIFVWDLGGQIIEANEAVLRLLGYEHDDLISGRIRWTDLTPAEWRLGDEQAIAEMTATGTVQPYEKELLRKNGDRVPVLIGAAAFDQRRLQGVAFVLDLTERKQGEKEARENERRHREMQMELAHANRVATVGQLSASIAHEVKQPIGAAVVNSRAALRWLRRQPPDVEKAVEAVQEIAKNGERASEIVAGIRTLFMKAPRCKESFDVNEAAREVIMIAQGEARKNGISVHMALGEGLPHVKGDRIQLQQVMLNLINNAFQAMSATELASPELVITSKSDRDSIAVAFHDSGPGLDPGNPERVFEAFYTTKPGGLGMGLSICRSIVEAHGGRLWASTNTPHGATFQFTLPVQDQGPSQQ